MNKVAYRATKRKLECAATSAKKKSPAVVRELWIYDGTDCVGTVTITEDAEFIAQNLAGKRIGFFSSLSEASAALKPVKPVADAAPRS
jgi:hypothetical protein